MEWTKEKPVEDGFYWVRSCGRDTKPIVVQMFSGVFYVPGEDAMYGPNEFGKSPHWCKIPQPETKKEPRRCLFKKPKAAAVKSFSPILRPEEAAEFLGISRPTLYRWAKELPDFPAQVKLGPRIGGWRKDELEAWLASR